MFHVTGPDLHDQRRVVDRMLAARRRPLRHPAGERRWTIAPPAGSESGWTLDERLDHRDRLAACRAAWEQPSA